MIKNKQNMKKWIISLLLFASLAEGVKAQNRFYGFSGNVNNDLGTGNNGTSSAGCSALRHPVG
jgi:hypothetical protein